MSESNRAENLNAWLNGQDQTPAVIAAVAAMAKACIEISLAVRSNALSANAGNASGVTNVQGETQLNLDVICNDICLSQMAKQPDVALIVSEENENVLINPGHAEQAGLAVCFDPLDGSNNVATNAGIGTIFSVLDVSKTSGTAEQKVLSATKFQRAAGYALFGPATLFVVTLGKQVAMFALDEGAREFLLINGNMRIPEVANEFSINVSYDNHWPDHVRTYVQRCIAGKKGPREKTFNMRWAGAMVADVHRVFIKGGHFIYPAMTHPGGENGKLRLLYEGIPMAMLVECAGGKAMANAQRLAEVSPTSIHQRTPVSLGSAKEVDYLAKLMEAN